LTAALPLNLSKRKSLEAVSEYPQRASPNEEFVVCGNPDCHHNAEIDASAAAYIMALPKAKQQSSEWQAAGERLSWRRKIADLSRT
jgi:hypothetical protein